MMSNKQSFPPIIHSDSTLLVLGSMPGDKSLRDNEYYAHPQNLFWPMVVGDKRTSAAMGYADKLQLLKQKKIALWDVLQQCERSGSLDAKIKAKTEKANDIVSLLKEFNAIKVIAFNGVKAYSSFNKLLQKQHQSFFSNYQLLCLPSTSPANAAIGLQEKLAVWKKII